MLASELIEAVRRRCRIPDDSSVASDQEILDLANEEMQLTLIPLITTSRTDYYVKSEDQSVVDSTTDYRIPERAVLAGLRDVLLVNSDGREQSLDQVPLAESWRYERAETGLSGNTLRLKYYRRPNTIIPEADAAKVTTVNTTNSLKASGGVGNVTQEEDADVIEGRPNWDWLDIDNNVAFISGTTITLTTGVDEISVGDWIAPAGQTPLVQLPTELQGVLVCAVSLYIHELLGDQAAYTRTEGSMGRYVQLARAHLEPRVRGEAPRLINYSSPLRDRGARYGEGWGGSDDSLGGIAFTIEGDYVRLLKPGGRFS